ncbi:MAG: protein YgfX [Paraglaciecola sp.]|uniref:protein YgfX n=1 Tax=Paraglaciecola sp. TaxID=1920173 RepID=UPI003298FC65
MMTYLVVVASIFTWQSSLFKYQLVLQVFIAIAVLILALKSLHLHKLKRLPTIIFSEDGYWIETVRGGQVNFRLSAQSRVTGVLLFINIISPLTPDKSQWRLVYKDQVNERTFRRLCKAIIYKQQTVSRSV